MIRLSLDTETLGIRPGSQLLQLACVDLDCPFDYFNVYVAQEGQSIYGLKADANTLAWWQEQDSAVRAKVFSGTVPLRDAIEAFANWFKDVRGQEQIELWMNSPSFDSEKILQPIFSAISLPLPWNYWEERDFRTLQNLGKTYFNFSYQKPAGAHDALADAKAQGEYIYQLTYRMIEP